LDFKRSGKMTPIADSIKVRLHIASIRGFPMLGRLWQLLTVQFHFNMPTCFEMECGGEDGEHHQPMVQRALFGSVERFFGVWLEQYARDFPVWLAPVQLVDSKPTTFQR
jgi:hypothetical protein